MSVRGPHTDGHRRPEFEDAVARDAWRWKGAPKTKMVVRGVNDTPTTNPLLVCVTCKEWTRHRKPIEIVDSATHGAKLDEVWSCAACGTRRVWGARQRG